jgi:TolB-like protein
MFISKLFAKIFIIIFSLQTSILTGWAAVNVAILPFKVHSDEDITYLKDGVLDMLSSRIGIDGKIFVIEQSKVKEAIEGIEGELDWDKIQSIGYRLDSDYIITGSLSKIGNSISIDGKIINTEKEEPPIRFSIECREIDEVISKIVLLAKDLRKKIIDTQQKTSSNLPLFSIDKSEFPQEEKIFPGEPAGRPFFEKAELEPKASVSHSKPETITQKVKIETGKISLNYWRSKKISENIRGLAVGEVDGDGNQEIVLITDKKVLICRKVDEKLKRLAEYKEKGPVSFLRVDLADINGNGVSEIFVTNLRKNSLDSFVLEYKNEEVVKIADNLEWFLGMVNFPGEGPILLAQAYGKDNPFKGEIYRINWDSESYVPKKLKEIPSGIQIFGLGVLGGKGSRERAFIQLDHQGRLSIYSQNGNVKWKDERTYGGSVISFKTISNRSTNHDKEETISIPMRLIITDLNNDKKEDIILGKNFSKDKGLLNRKSVYENGMIYNLQWNGDSMNIRSNTGKLDECVIDYSVADVDNDGEDELAVAVREEGQSFIKFRPKSYLLIYEIS